MAHKWGCGQVPRPFLFVIYHSVLFGCKINGYSSFTVAEADCLQSISSIANDSAPEILYMRNWEQIFTHTIDGFFVQRIIGQRESIILKIFTIGSVVYGKSRKGGKGLLTRVQR